jgi:nitrite reductase/ring-hydroxylating ferredoxin subunit
MPWIRAGALAELTDVPRVVNHPPRQIAVFRRRGEFFAIDNRCPHEGYPLAAGSVDAQGVLTCNWHNWKFRLEDGECILGGDHVRAYPTRTEDGQLWIDISDPPKQAIEAGVLRGLEAGFKDRDFGRICRELARLDFHGIDPTAGVVRAIEWAHDRLEFGTTHSMAATADWLALGERMKDDRETRIIVRAEAVDHFAFDALRQREFPFPPPSDEPFDEAVFLEEVEAENAKRAEEVIARALDDDIGWEKLEAPLARAALAHYNDFGHSLIYVAKAGELLKRLGPATRRPIVLPLVRSIACATREDLIPEFRNYRPALDALPPIAAGDPSPVETLPFPSTTKQAFEWLRTHAQDHPAPALYDRLLEALALSMLQFDSSYGVAYDRPVSQNVSWLDFTHGLTFANAVRTLASRHPDLWPAGLLQMACFLGRNRPFIVAESEMNVADWEVGDPEGFLRSVHQRLLDHGMRDPIFAAHLLKTTIAVEAELDFASPSCRRALLASLHRFVDSPIRTKHVRRLARQAIELVGRDFRSSNGPGAPI